MSTSEQTSTPVQQQTNAPISATQTITVPEGTRVAARVKWFDNTMNYGFATVLEGEHTGKDIFVHQSKLLTVGQNVYRTLRPGEYVEFALEEVQGNEHKHQAVHVTGPRACPLMCETNPQRRRPAHNNVARIGGGYKQNARDNFGYIGGGYIPTGPSQTGFYVGGYNPNASANVGRIGGGYIPTGPSQTGYHVGRGRGRGAGRRPVESSQ